MGPWGPGSPFLPISPFGPWRPIKQHSTCVKIQNNRFIVSVEHLHLAAPVAEVGLIPAFTTQWHSHKAVEEQGWMAPQESV